MIVSHGILIITVITLLVSTLHAQNDSDWPDYYQILGIDDARNATPADVKAAYRSMAKQWHPDKAHKNTTTKEQANKQFVKIAEAYQVLSDNQTRADYDRYYWQRQQQQQPQQQQQQHPWKISNWRDPWRLFQEVFDWKDLQSFFAEEWKARTADRTFDTYNDDDDHTKTRHVDTHEQFHIDPYSGYEIRTVYQTIDVLQSNGRLRYQIWAQDFVEVFDGWSFTWHELTPQPYLVQEGYRDELGQVLTPYDRLVRGRYQARVSRNNNCEWRIVDVGRGGHVVWSSQTNIPALDCQLQLVHGQLQLVARQFMVEWSSTNAPEFGSYGVVARLDLDGNVAIYDNEHACLWATGPFGCHRMGRLVTRLWRDTCYQWFRLWQWIDRVLEE